MTKHTRKLNDGNSKKSSIATMRTGFTIKLNGNTTRRPGNPPKTSAARKT
ncbi:hypothetical protein BofuT4_uP037310.1 [Botrytis cinerea T4]|uniref:Uncharacterized protein n=1 Tax=Botryotinia fuckeliana (strain T4) TaxID=999810 RepID=G2Y511_BOTF4|nr:hypothetical protein BofuT4_uP037310.1 [Botrytis cinerea T4]